MQTFGFPYLRIDAKHRSITSSRTLTLDPDTLWRRASQSEWTAAHEHGAKLEIVAR